MWVVCIFKPTKNSKYILIHLGKCFLKHHFPDENLIGETLDFGELERKDGKSHLSRSQLQIFAKRILLKFKVIRYSLVSKLLSCMLLASKTIENLYLRHNNYN